MNMKKANKENINHQNFRILQKKYKKKLHYNFPKELFNDTVKSPIGSDSDIEYNESDFLLTNEFAKDKNFHLKGQ